MLRLSAFVLAAGLAGAALLPSNAPEEAPPLGPGAVISMHHQLFRALDEGDVERAVSFLSKDLNMDREYGQRPCTAFLVDPKGKPVSADDHDATRALFERWAQAPGKWETKIITAMDDCASADVSWCTLTFQRTGLVDGEQVVQHYRSTALVTYDGGWKLTHLHVSSDA